MRTRRLTCPVCSARFRASTECARCGADLTAIMKTVLRAYRARRAARSALWQGNYPAMSEHARLAQDIHANEQGARLELLARWLVTTFTKRHPE